MRFLFAVLGAALLIASVPGSTLAADEPTLITSTAYAELGDPYRLGAEGPNRYDCSGFVWWTYSSAGLGDRIGGKRMRAREYQSWFRQRSQLFTDPKQVEIGDLAFWGSPAVHIGIVTRIVHAQRRPLVRVFVTGATTDKGVAEVRLDRLQTTRAFAGFANVGLANVPDPTPTPEQTPTASPL